MKAVYISMFVAGISMLVACSKSADPFPTLDIQGNMEQGDQSWYEQVFIGTILTLTTEASQSSSHSVKIEIPVDTVTHVPYWGHRYSGTPPIGKNVVLSVSIKATNLLGQGAAIQLAAVGATNTNIAYAIEGPASGTFDWTTYRAKLENVPTGTVSLYVYLYVLPGTQGIVYFDNATLTVD